MNSKQSATRVLKELKRIDDLQAQINVFRPFSKELLVLWQ